MSNYEYAQATQEQLDAWEWAAYEAWQYEQNAEYDMRMCAWYAAQGLSNIY